MKKILDNTAKKNKTKTQRCKKIKDETKVKEKEGAGGRISLKK